ncbi:MAG: hypothetical protein GVY18_01325 [Bacteroidetes bacterium]|nr:hypothetical protein [Bacteroidota bacterium]
MRRRRSFLLMFVVLLLGAAPSLGQPVHAPVTSSSDALLDLSSNLPTAHVYADSLYLGVAIEGVFRVPPGSTTVRVVPAEGDAWSIAPQVQPIDVQAGDTLSLTMDFPYHYKVETIPFGAPVYLEGAEGRELLGTTPLVHRSDAPLERSLLIDHKGYKVEEIAAPGRNVWNRHVLTLDPAQPVQAEATGPEVDWKPPPKRRRWIDVAAASVAVAAGVYSIHQKFRADDIYDQYQDARDPALKSRIEAHDARALAGLGVMQVGLGVLTFRLIRR